MSDKFVYQNARIKSRETKLLTSQSLQRLLECTTLSDAFRTLLDMGFGGGAQVAVGDFDALFEKEGERQLEFLKEFNVDGALDAFLIQYDYLNLKALLKARAGGKLKTFAEGLYAVEQLSTALEQDKFEELPVHFRRAAEFVCSGIANGTATPRKIDCAVDREMYADIADRTKRQGKLIRTYFETRADFANLSTFMRCRRYALDKQIYLESEVPGGNISYLKDIYEESDEKLLERLKGSVYFDAVKTFAEDGNIPSFEVERDNALLRMVKSEKDDMFSAAPILAYHLGRVTELGAAKLIIAGIKNKVVPSKIKERMRELYA